MCGTSFWAGAPGAPHSGESALGAFGPVPTQSKVWEWLGPVLQAVGVSPEIQAELRQVTDEDQKEMKAILEGEVVGRPPDSSKIGCHLPINSLGRQDLEEQVSGRPPDPCLGV